MEGIDIKKDVDMLWRRLTQSAAQPELWMDLVCSYAHAGLLWQAGYAARQAVKYDEKLLARLQGLDLGSWRDITAGDALLGRSDLPDAGKRAEQFQEQLEEVFIPDLDGAVDTMVAINMATMEIITQVFRTIPVGVANPMQSGTT